MKVSSGIAANSEPEWTDSSILDALVTRNIGDIEAAQKHARELGRSLLEQIETVLADEFATIIQTAGGDLSPFCGAASIL